MYLILEEFPLHSTYIAKVDRKMWNAFYKDFKLSRDSFFEKIVSILPHISQNPEIIQTFLFFYGILPGVQDK